MATRSSARIPVLLLWICSLWSAVKCQVLSPYATLSSDPYISTSEGVFTWPQGDTSTFDEGSEMTISWTATFENVNLYLIWNYNISLDAPITNQVQIVTNYAQKSYQWTVTCNPDCGRPYVFRAVDAQGTSDEQTVGGFWSRLFWIHPISTSSSTMPATTTSSLSTISALKTTPTSTTVSDAAAAASTTPAGMDTNVGSSSSTAIGVGVGVGVGVVLLLVAAFFVWRYYRKKGKQNNRMLEVSQTNPDHKSPSAWQQTSDSHPPHGVYEAPSPDPVYEVQGYTRMKLAEAPGSEVASGPHELEGR